jgi:hypothetical protein
MASDDDDDDDDDDARRQNETIQNKTIIQYYSN